MKTLPQHFIVLLSKLLLSVNLLWVDCNCKPQHARIPTNPPSQESDNKPIIKMDEKIEAAQKAGYPFLANKLEQLQLNPAIANINEPNPNKNDRTALHEAVELGNREIVECLLNNKAINATDRNGNQPLDVWIEQFLKKPTDQRLSYLPIGEQLLDRRFQFQNPDTVSALLEDLIKSGEINNPAFKRLLESLESFSFFKDILTASLAKSINQGLPVNTLQQVLGQFPTHQSQLAASLLNQNLLQKPQEAIVALLLKSVSEAADQIRI